MDFEPPSFSLGSGFYSFPPRSPCLAPSKDLAGPELTGFPSGIPERRFKRLRRVVETGNDDCLLAGLEDEIEEVSEDEARTESGISKTTGYSRLPFVKGTPRNGSYNGWCRSESVSAKFSSGLGRHHPATSSCAHPAPNSYELASNNDVCSLGPDQLDHANEHPHTDIGWRMRQPNFENTDASPLSTKAGREVVPDDPGLGPCHPSDGYRGLESSCPSVPNTRPHGQGRGICDVIELEDDWDHVARSFHEEIENIDPTGVGQSGNGPEVYHTFQDDKKMVEFLRNRFPNFIPVDALCAGHSFQGEPVYIDYRNQFLSSPTSNARHRPSSQSHQGERARRDIDGQDNSRLSAKRPKGRAPRRNRTAASSQSISLEQTGSTGGFWTTEKTGKRIYVTRDGRKLMGQIAYRQHLKENPKKAKGSQMKALCSSKKRT